MAEDSSAIVVKPQDEELSPIILRVGKKKKRAVKDLKRGRGRLMDEVEQTLADVRAGLGAAVNGKDFVPVILIYREKPKRKRRGFGRIGRLF